MQSFLNTFSMLFALEQHEKLEKEKKKTLQIRSFPYTYNNSI